MPKLRKRIKTEHLFYALLLVASIAVGVFYVVGTIYYLASGSKEILESNNMNSNSILAKSKMTEFDRKLAKEIMDKNNDGRCDFCGMMVEMCIEAGMMECTMDPNARIGLLGSDHYHA